MIFKSKKGRAKVLGSKSSRNSYFSRSRLIVRPSALRHLIFASIWAIWQKLCWNCLFSEFCDRGYMSVCLFLSFLFCGSDVFLLRCFFLWPCFVMKLGALPWSSCDGFVTASRTENREGFKNEHPWGVRFKPCPALPFLRNFLSHTIRGDAAMWFWTREMWLKMVLCPGPTKHTPAQPKTDLQNVTQTGPADEPNFWSPGRAQSTIFSKKNCTIFQKNSFFWTHPDPKSRSPVGPKNGPKKVPKFRHAFKKVYKNSSNVTKNGPANGSNFWPQGRTQFGHSSDCHLFKKIILKIK